VDFQSLRLGGGVRKRNYFCIKYRFVSYFNGYIYIKTGFLYFHVIVELDLLA
jgi:hypothetical protein